MPLFFFLFTFLEWCFATPLYFDIKPGQGADLPKNYRDHHSTSYNGLDLGFLFAASGQFSEKQLGAVLKHLQKKGHSLSNIHIFDLRQEPHFFADGTPFTSFDPFRQKSWGHSTTKILDTENDWVFKNRCSKMDIFHIKRDKKTQKIIKKGAKNTHFGHTFQTEQDLVKAKGAQYYRVPITDYRYPDLDIEIDSFLDIYDSIKGSNPIFYVHCKGGKGRTSTFVLMLDMLKNASRHSLTEIHNRHLGTGNRNMLHTSPHNDYKACYSMERLKFLVLFHAFAKQRILPGGIQKWSIWFKNFQNQYKGRPHDFYSKQTSFKELISKHHQRFPKAKDSLLSKCYTYVKLP